MPVVNIPNVGSVTFPDTMSPEDITKAIETDILKTAPKEDTSLLKKFTSGAASLGDIVAGAPAFAVGAVGAPLVSTYQGLVEGKTPKEAAQEGLQYQLQVGVQNYYNKAYQTKSADAWVDGFMYGLNGVKEGKPVGLLNTKEGAEKRERQVQFFKHQNG